MAETGLYRRGGIWQSRVMVPKDLRTHFSDKAGFRKSLRTSDREEAKLRHAEHVADCRRRFAEARRGHDLAGLPPPGWRLPASLPELERKTLLTIRERLDEWSSEGMRLAATAEQRHSPERDPGELGNLLRSLDAESDSLGGSVETPERRVEHYPSDEAALRRAVGWFLGLHSLTLHDFPADAHSAVIEAARQARHWWIALRQECILDACDPERPGPFRAKFWQRLAALGIAGASPEYGERPQVARQREPKGPTLAQALDLWQAKPNKRGSPRTADMVGKVNRAMALLLEFAAGYWPERTVTADSILLSDFDPLAAEAFRDWLVLRSDLKGKTKKDRLHDLKGLFKTAGKHLPGWTSPFANVQPIDTSDSEAGRPFTPAELQAIFSAPVFQQYCLDFSGLDAAWKSGGAAAYWVPILALYHGPRVTELCQLEVADVACAANEDGGQPIPVLDLAKVERNGADAEQPGSGQPRKRRKTPAASRRIPVHRAVLALGFMEYVDDMRHAGHTRLFPDIKTAPGGLAGDYFGTFFGAFRRSRGVREAGVGTHAFRHTLRTRLASLPGVPQDVLDYLVGHSDGKHVRERYIHLRDTPNALRRVLDAVDYPGLTLPRVYRRRSDALTSREAATAPSSPDSPTPDQTGSSVATC